VASFGSWWQGLPYATYVVTIMSVFGVCRRSKRS
jgi:hypothetical protein